MPLWKPDNRFSGEDVFIVGGGPSLAGFEFERLRGKNVIGVNNCCDLGDLIDVLFFWDYQPTKAGDFFTSNYEKLKSLKALVITHHQLFMKGKEDWVYWYPSQLTGIYKDKIGKNSSSGASAINVALILGAKRVFLLGIDGKPSEDKGNWYREGKPRENQVYRQFIEGFENVKRTYEGVFPKTEIINLNLDSAVECFPFADPKYYL